MKHSHTPLRPAACTTKSPETYQGSSASCTTHWLTILLCARTSAAPAYGAAFFVDGCFDQGSVAEQPVERALLVVEQVQPLHQVVLRPELVQEGERPRRVPHHPHPVHAVVVRREHLVHRVVRPSSSRTAGFMMSVSTSMNTSQCPSGRCLRTSKILLHAAGRLGSATVRLTIRSFPCRSAYRRLFAALAAQMYPAAASHSVRIANLRAFRAGRAESVIRNRSSPRRDSCRRTRLGSLGARTRRDDDLSKPERTGESSAGESRPRGWRSKTPTRTRPRSAASGPRVRRIAGGR